MNLPLSWPARLVFLACLVLQACSKPVPAEEPVRAVKVLTVGLDAMQSGAEYAGEVRSRVESRLGFRVGGKLLRRHVEMGQHVKAGELLAQLDPQDFKLAADGARAQLAAATTNRDLALADAKRYKDLREQNFISAAELERRDTALKAAQAQVDQAQAQLAALGNQTAYANLVADVAGVVTSVDAEPGQVLAAGTPILRIAQDGPRDGVFAVPEDKVGKLKVGSQVLVQAWAEQKSASASVREVAASADPVTRTFTVKVGLNGPETWPLGSTVTIAPKALDRSGPSVIKLPTSALQHDGEKAAVWVLEKATMTVRLQPIAIATADGNEVVVSQGLEPGMQVVSVGAHVLNPGQKVTIYQSKQAAAAAATPSVPAQ
ncbi:MAG: efflux RND transporter periplasmic adaptor subunit [Rhodoferax sp.]|jgi:RND family efflux transporter MFP subunit|nr:efflux RND transporter periplasmic adaptor subunit [Rhodoferax sp.]MBJ7469032.1 efflux RND transporter periplasmic adaptor subunit [Rhodoferax sp.]